MLYLNASKSLKEFLKDVENNKIEGLSKGTREIVDYLFDVEKDKPTAHAKTIENEYDR